MIELHESTLALVKEERRLTSLVIDNLQKIYEQKLFLQMSYSSMFEYVTRGLGYSESCAYRRISAVKMTREIPEVKAKLDDGSLNLTNLTLAQGFFSKENLTVENKREVLNKIQNCSKRVEFKNGDLRNITKVEIERGMGSACRAGYTTLAVAKL